MRRVNSKSVAESVTRAKIVQHKPFSADELLKHISPGTQEEAEEFVRLIYAERRRDFANSESE
jgi:hypothetical protein